VIDRVRLEAVIEYRYQALPPDESRVVVAREAISNRGTPEWGVAKR
jgi:hypothetical protein